MTAFFAGFRAEWTSRKPPPAPRPKRPSRAAEPSSRRRLWFRFVAGLAYSALVAFPLCLATQCAFPLVLASVVGVFLVCGGLGVWWMTLWARQKDARLGQFTVGSMLFLMVYVAIFFGTLRWTVDRVSLQFPRSDDADILRWVFVMWPLLALVSARIVLHMTEAVLWVAVWLVKRPRVRRDSEGKGDSGSPPTARRTIK
jgi:hypothetical protein